MRTLSGVGAVGLGVAGVLLCAAAVGLGWWVAAQTADGGRLGGAREPRGGARATADAINGAGEVLNAPRARIEAMKSTAAVRLTGELITLAREVAAGWEQLAAALAAARREIGDARGRAAESRDGVVFWVYVCAVANTLVCLWVGLGQLCLIGWGRRRMANRRPSTL